MEYLGKNIINKLLHIVRYYHFFIILHPTICINIQLKVMHFWVDLQISWGKEITLQL